MIDDLNKELEAITQKWTKIPNGPCLWLRKWENKYFRANHAFMRSIPFISVENHLIAISSGGGLIATYQKADINFSNISKKIHVFSPNWHFINDISLKLQKPNDTIEWYEFSEVSYIAFTPDELIVVLLNNFTILLFNSLGALINFSTFKSNNNLTIIDLPKLLNARLVSYSLAIISTNNSFFYIPDVRKPVWFTSQISEFNQYLFQNFDFVPLNDFSYPLLFYINNEFSINVNLNMKSKVIKIPEYKILGLSISPDLSNIACLMSNQIENQNASEEQFMFCVLFCDRQFTPSKRKIVSITRQKLTGTSNTDSIISELPNFVNFCWCGKTSVLINFVKYCIFVDISGGICIIENPTSQLIISPEIDGVRIICQTNGSSHFNHTNNDKNQKKTPKFAFQCGHNFLSIVPEFLESIFKKKYTYLCQNYIEWTKGNFKEEDSSNFDDDSLKEKIISFVEASKYITETNIQQIFLGTSWFSQSFLDPMKRISNDNDKLFSKTFEKIRILHLLREDLNVKEKTFTNMLITYEEMEFLTFPTIINRLCNRGAHATALIISKIVEVEKTPIFNHKALMLIYTNIRLSLKKPQKKSSETIVGKITKDIPHLDYSQLAMAALKFGDKRICLELLEKEEKEIKKMPVFLLLGDIKNAFEIAFKNNDQKMINFVAQYAINHDEVDAVTSYYNKALLPSARFNSSDNKQISLLIFMIRNMKKDALLSYLFSILKKKLLPPDDISFELSKNLTKNNLYHPRECYDRYIQLLKWIKEKGDEQMANIISIGISTNVRPIVKAQLNLINSYSALDDNQQQQEEETTTATINNIDEPELNPISNDNDQNVKQRDKPIPEPTPTPSQNPNQNQDNESESKKKRNQAPGNKSDIEPQSESKSKSKSKKNPKTEKDTKSKKKQKSKQKSKKLLNTDSDSDSASDQNSSFYFQNNSDSDTDSDSEQEQQNRKKGKKKNDKIKEKDKKKEKKQSSAKKKSNQKEAETNKKKAKIKGNINNGDEKLTTNKNDDADSNKNAKDKKTKSDKPDQNNNQTSNASTKTDETQKPSDNTTTTTKNEENKKSDNLKDINNNIKNNNNNDSSNNSNNDNEINKDENDEESKKKKRLKPNLKIPFLFKNIQKNKSEKENENKDESITETEIDKKEEIKKEEKVNNENEVKKSKQGSEESVDHLQFSYSPKFRNNISAMKAIEFELCNGRREEANKLASLLNLSESRYTWLLINFFLRTNANDDDLLQITEKIGLIDGLWVVRRCIVLNRLNIAAAFLENISNPSDKKQARIELQKAITSKQLIASKVDVENIL